MRLITKKQQNEAIKLIVAWGAITDDMLTRMVSAGKIESKNAVEMLKDNTGDMMRLAHIVAGNDGALYTLAAFQHARKSLLKNKTQCQQQEQTENQ